MEASRYLRNVALRSTSRDTEEARISSAPLGCRVQDVWALGLGCRAQGLGFGV